MSTECDEVHAERPRKCFRATTQPPRCAGDGIAIVRASESGGVLSPDVALCAECAENYAHTAAGEALAKLRMRGATLHSAITITLHPLDGPTAEGDQRQ